MGLLYWVLVILCSSPTALWIGDRESGIVWRVVERRGGRGAFELCEDVVGIEGLQLLVWSRGLWLGTAAAGEFELRWAEGSRAGARGAVREWRTLPGLRLAGEVVDACAARGGGVHLLSATGELVTVQRHSGAPQARTRASVPGAWRIAEDRAGVLWIGTFDGALWRLRGSGCGALERCRGPDSRAVDDLVADPGGDGIWCVLGAPGPACLHLDRRARLRRRSDLPFEAAALHVERGRIWVAAASEAAVASTPRRGGSASWSVRRVAAGDLHQLLGIRGRGVLLVGRTRVLLCDRGNERWRWRGGPGIVATAGGG